MARGRLASLCGNILVRDNVVRVPSCGSLRSFIGNKSYQRIMAILAMIFGALDRQ